MSATGTDGNPASVDMLMLDDSCQKPGCVKLLEEKQKQVDGLKRELLEANKYCRELRNSGGKLVEMHREKGSAEIKLREQVNLLTRQLAEAKKLSNDLVEARNNQNKVHKPPTRPVGQMAIIAPFYQARPLYPGVAPLIRPPAPIPVPAPVVRNPAPIPVAIRHAVQPFGLYQPVSPILAPSPEADSLSSNLSTLSDDSYSIGSEASLSSTIYLDTTGTVDLGGSSSDENDDN